jgi:signal transduction histidine kinase
MEDNLPYIQVDQDAIEQAILNLLSNAMKYSGEEMVTP